MGKNKLERFAEIAEFDNVLELTDFQDADRPKPAGRWNSGIFTGTGPLVLELACGKGEYTLELARRNPRQHFVGIDIKGARIWKGAKTALEEDLGNVRFLRIYIDHLDEYFAAEEVDSLWITFPDPYPKWSDRTKRLTSPKFLKIYRRILSPGGVVHLKTDSDRLFRFSIEMAETCNCEILDLVEDIYTERPNDEMLTVKTYYERKHLEQGKTIRYLEFRLPEKPIEYSLK